MCAKDLQKLMAEKASQEGGGSSPGSTTTDASPRASLSATSPASDSEEEDEDEDDEEEEEEEEEEGNEEEPLRLRGAGPEGAVNPNESLTEDDVTVPDGAGQDGPRDNGKPPPPPLAPFSVRVRCRLRSF